MARRLEYTVHLPVHVVVDGVKSLDRVDVFVRGTELPEWAVPFVGRHVYEEGEAPEDAPTNPAPAIDPQKSDEQPPAGNASAEVWRAYAVSKGADPASVADLSRDDLRDRFGKS